MIECNLKGKEREAHLTGERVDHLHYLHGKEIGPFTEQ